MPTFPICVTVYKYDLQYKISIVDKKHINFIYYISKH